MLASSGMPHHVDRYLDMLEARDAGAVDVFGTPADLHAALDGLEVFGT